jgi:hypothetical protein
MTLGPTIQIFEQFQKDWATIDKSNYCAMDSPIMSSQQVKKLIEEAKIALLSALKSGFARDDYQEMIELSLIILNCHPDVENYVFKIPGANHRARWMAKVIYCLKMYLFRKEFEMTAELEINFQELSLFFALIYAKNWISSPIAADAAINDLNLYTQLTEYNF